MKSIVILCVGILLWIVLMTAGVYADMSSSLIPIGNIPVPLGHMPGLVVILQPQQGGQTKLFYYSMVYDTSYSSYAPMALEELRIEDVDAEERIDRQVGLYVSTATNEIQWIIDGVVVASTSFAFSPELGTAWWPEIYLGENYDLPMDSYVYIDNVEEQLDGTTSFIDNFASGISSEWVLSPNSPDTDPWSYKPLWDVNGEAYLYTLGVQSQFYVKSYMTHRGAAYGTELDSAYISVTITKAWAEGQEPSVPLQDYAYFVLAPLALHRHEVVSLATSISIDEKLGFFVRAYSQYDTTTNRHRIAVETSGQTPPVWEDFQFISHTDYHSYCPTVMITDDGKIDLVYQRQPVSGGESEIVVSTSSDAGKTWS